MIKQIFNVDNLGLTQSWYGKKIQAYVNAYGADYDFCRLFQSDSGGNILIYNSTMAADGVFDADELAGFISMANPQTIEVSKDTPLQLEDGYEKLNKTLFKAISAENNVDGSTVKVNTLLADIFEILQDGFGLDEFDMWYVDIMHRIRHGVSDIYLYENTTVTKLFDIDNYVFLSHIATASESRGKGSARNLLYYLCGEFEKQGKEVYLYAKDERKTFYNSIGFKETDSDIFYERIN